MDQESHHYKLDVLKRANDPDSFKINISRSNPAGMQSCSFITNFATQTCDHTKNLFAPFDLAQTRFDAQAQADSFLWDIPDFGLLKLHRDGSTFFGHTADDAPLLHNKLALHTSGKLFLQTLKVTALQLESRETQVCEALVADEIATERLIHNTGSLQTARLLGVGTFLNEGRLEFKGTKEEPALLGIQRFENKNNNHCTPTVSADHLRVTKDNKYLLAAKNTNFEVSGKLAIDQQPGVVEFHNEGICKIYEGNLQRHIINEGFFQADTLTAQSINNKEFGQVKILDKMNVAGLANEGDIDVNRSIQVQEGINKGAIVGSPILALHVSGNLNNDGQIRLGQLAGTGHVINKKSLLFNDNSCMTVKSLINYGLIKAESLHLHKTQLSNMKKSIIELFGKSVMGDAHINNDGDLTIQGDTDLTSTGISNRGNIVCRSGALACKNSKLCNKGDWLIEEFKSVDPLEIDNQGALELINSSIDFERMRNYKDLLIRGGTCTFKKLINSGNMQTDLLHLIPQALLQNLQDGSIQVFEKSLFDNAEVINDGHCMMQGETNFLLTRIYNRNTMTIKQGSIDCTHMTLRNLATGKWLMERMKSVQPITLFNEGIFELAQSSLDFNKIQNDNDLVLHSGSYRVNDFKNKALHLRSNDWTITDNPAEQTDNKLVLTNPNIKDTDLGNIQGEHKLTYDLAVMPTTLQAADIDLSDRLCTLQELQAITTGGKVIARCSPEQLAQGDIELPNIGHLELYVTGPLTKYGTLKAPALTLHVQGALAVGKSNAELGIIAATHGPLAITAENIDGKFAKFYGKGKTDIIATKGNIVIGAEARGIDETIKQQFVAGALSSIWKNFWGLTMYLPSFDYSLSVRNGAYVASDDFLTLRSPTKVSICYGELFGVLGASIDAPAEVLNHASKISSYGPISIETDLYNHVRSPHAVRYAFPYTASANTEYPGSIAPMLESLKRITFKTKKIYNLAGSIRSGEDIILNGKGILTPAMGYFEEPQHFYLRTIGYSCNSLFLTQACTLQAGKTIQMNLGHFVVTGNMNAPGILMFAGTGMFANSCMTRDTQDATRPRIVDVTQFMRQEAQQPGFYQIDAQGAVQTQFPFGVPSTPQMGDLVALENPQYQTPLNWHTIFNPLSSINLDLHLQQLLSNFAGKVYAGRAKGNALSRVLWGNANRWREQNNREVMSQTDLQQVHQSMLLAQIAHNGMTEEQRMLLYIAPQDINAYQAPGDIVADQFVCVTEGDQTHVNNRIIAQGPEGVTLQSQTGSVHLQTQAYTVQYGDGDGGLVTEQRDYPQQQLIAQQGPVNVIAHNNIERTATAIAAGTHVHEHAQTGSVIKNPLVLQTLVATQKKDDGLFSSKTTITTQLSHNVLPSTTIAGTVLHNQAGSSIHAVASQDAAGQEIIYQSPNTVIEGIILANCQTTKTEKSGTFSDESHYQSQETPCALPSTIQAPIVRFAGDTARINANIVAQELHDHTVQGVQFVATVKEMLYSQQTLVNSPFMSIDAGVKGGYETMIAPMLMVERIIRANNNGHMLFESVIMDRNRTEIIGNFVETTYQLKRWETSWCHKSQVVSDEVLVLAAIAIAIVTNGMGVELLAPLLESFTVATGMQLSAAGVAMLNAGVTAICSATATSFLRTGDPLQTVEHLASDKFLKSLVFDMASAGLCSKLGGMLDINMASGIKPLISHVQEQTLRTTVDTLLNVAINHAPVDQALANACKQIPLKAVAGYVSNNICTSHLNGLGQKAVHTLLGGATGFATEGTKKGLISGAVGALTAQTVGDILTSDAFAISDAAIGRLKNTDQPLTPENIQDAISKEIAYRMKIAKITAGTVAALAKLNPSIAMQTAANVIDNDMAIRTQIYAMAEMQSLLTAASQAVAHLAVQKPEQPAEQTTTVPKKRKPEATSAKTGRKPEVASAETGRKPIKRSTLQDYQDANTAHDLVLHAMQNPVSTYDDLIMECAQEWQPHNYAQKEKKQRSLMDRIVNPEMSPFIKETSQIIREAFDHAINETIDTFAYVPNPVGFACFATSTGRDIYQERTTVGEVAFNTTVTYGALKGIQLTGRGIKKIYNYAQSKLRRSTPELYVSFSKNSLVGKSAHVTPGTDSILNKLYQARSTERRIPFVENPLAGEWSSATISGDLVLGSDAFNIAYEKCTRYVCKIDPAAPFNVVSHGNSLIMALEVPNIHPKALSQANLKVLKEKGEVILNAVQLARVIRTAHGYKKGHPIHLFSCETGAVPDGIAQKLSTRMGVEVSAFTENVHVHNDIPLFSAYSQVTKKVGAVKTFYPKSGVSKTIASSILLSGCDSSSWRSSMVQDEQQTRQRSLIDRIINPKTSPFIKETSEIIRAAFDHAINETINTYAYVPNPLGLACFATEVSRDIYQERTTLGELAFNAALAYGALKGIQLTGRGIKKLYDHSLNKLHQRRYAAEGRIPFVQTPRAGKWSDATIGGNLALSENNLLEIAVALTKWAKNPKAPFNVFAHGNPFLVVTDMASLHSKALSQKNLKILRKEGEVELNEVQLARVIRTAPGYKKGQHINLFVCGAGAKNHGLAQKLSTRMDVPVSAFTKIAHTIMSFKGGVNLEFETSSRLGIPGIMKTFYPESRKPHQRNSLMLSVALPALFLAGSESSHVNPVDTHDSLEKKYAQQKPFVQNPERGIWIKGCISGELMLQKGGIKYINLLMRYNLLDKDERCPFMVTAHGNPNSIQIDTQNIHPGGLSSWNEEALKRDGYFNVNNAYQLQKLIETAPGYKPGQNVILYSCECGAYPEGIAQQLADEMRVEVSAFTGFAATDFWGKYFASIKEETSWSGLKEIKTFYPRPAEQRRISNIPSWDY